MSPGVCPMLSIDSSPVTTRVLARRAVDWGVFRTSFGYYAFKLGLWIRRLAGWGL